MRRLKLLIVVAALATAASCDGGPAIIGTFGGVQPALRIVNAFTSPVDVLIDGNVAVSALAPGDVNTASTSAGSHTLVLRTTGGGISITESITTATSALSTIAATVNGGTLSAAVLDDTNNVIPDGATKLRVLHLAPNAGPLQVYRTQPDNPTPVPWQSPFNYQPNPSAAAFYQSTVGSWEVRAWQTPADSSGWGTATARITVPLASGTKATIIILDDPAGGVRLQVI